MLYICIRVVKGCGVRKERFGKRQKRRCLRAAAATNTTTVSRAAISMQRDLCVTARSQTSKDIKVVCIVGKKAKDTYRAVKRGDRLVLFEISAQQG